MLSEFVESVCLLSGGSFPAENRFSLLFAGSVTYALDGKDCDDNLIWQDRQATQSFEFTLDKPDDTFLDFIKTEFDESFKRKVNKTNGALTSSKMSVELDNNEYKLMVSLTVREYLDPSYEPIAVNSTLMASIVNPFQLVFQNTVNIHLALSSNSLATFVKTTITIRVAITIVIPVTWIKTPIITTQPPLTGCQLTKNKMWINNPGSKYFPNGDKCIPKDAEFDCNPNGIVLKIHVMHLYTNLPKSDWPKVTLNYGSCNGTNTPDASGWIIEKFAFGQCGGTIAQTATQIKNVWNISGPSHLANINGVIVDCIKFQFCCNYDPFARKETDYGVDVPSIKIQGNDYTFDDSFNLTLYDSSLFTNRISTAVRARLGSRIFGEITTTLPGFGAHDFDYQIQQCRVKSNGSVAGRTFIDINTCLMDAAVKAQNANIRPNTITGIIPRRRAISVATPARFSFLAFILDKSQRNITVECTIKMCLLDTTGINYYDPLCIKNTCTGTGW